MGIWKWRDETARLFEVGTCGIRALEKLRWISKYAQKPCRDRDGAQINADKLFALICGTPGHLVTASFCAVTAYRQLDYASAVPVAQHGSDNFKA